MNGRYFLQEVVNNIDHSSFIKDIKTSSFERDRRAFQSKKHVSLDVKTSRILERILNGSSSDEEFTDNRKHFQSRKHQSLDARVKLNLNKSRIHTTSSTDEEGIDEKGNLISERIHDYSKPIIIDFKDLDPSDDDEDDDDEEVEEVEPGDELEHKEDFEAARSTFQKQKAISVESRKR